jgi:hypothetical protein
VAHHKTARIVHHSRGEGFFAVIATRQPAASRL